MRASGFGWMAVALLVLSCAGFRAGAQEPASASRETRPASPSADFGPASMTKRVRALQPALEKVLGEPIPGPLLEVVASDRAEIEALCFEQGVIISSGLEGTASGEELRDEKRRMSKAVGWTLAGYVDEIDDTIHVVPTNFRDERGQDVLDVILIHEAVHVFQNRRLKMSRGLDRLRTLDDFMGIQAVVEGHAEWVAKAVARDLGLAESFAAHQRRLVEIPDFSDDPEAEAAARMAVEILTFAYVEGEKFVDFVVSRLGYAAAVERLFRDPPKSQHAVKNPPEYLVPRSDAVDPAEMGRRVRHLVPSKYRTQAIAAQAGLMRAGLAMLDKKTVDDAMIGYRGGTLVFGKPVDQKDSKKALLAVSFFVWDAPEQAAKGFEASISLRHKQDESAKEIIDSVEWGERETVDGATLVSCRKKVTLDEEEVDALSLITMKGRVCCEVSAVGLDLSRDDLVALAKRALTEVLAPRAEGLASDPASRPSKVQDADLTPPPEVSRADDTPVIHVGIEGELGYAGEQAVPGEFTINFWSLADADKPVRTAKGVNGRFSVELPAGVRTRLGMIVADGQPYDTHVGSRVTVKPGEKIRLEIKRPALAHLVVMDAATSRPVQGAKVYSTSWRSWQHKSDGDDLSVPDPTELRDQPVLTDAAGRATLRRLANSDDRVNGLLVVSPLHAWARHALTSSSTEQIRIVMRPGGGLRIRVDGWERLAEGTILLQRVETKDRLFRFTYPRGVADPDERGNLMVEGLETGTYGVLVTRGPHFKGGPVYGTALVEVKAGEVSEVSIKTEGGPPTVEVAGTLTLPVGYRHAGRELTLMLIGVDDVTKGSVLKTDCGLDRETRSGDFSFPWVQPGSWKLLVVEIQWLADVDVKPGMAALKLEAPDPVEASVKITDKATGEILKRPDGYWRATLPESAAGTWSVAYSRWDASKQGLTITVAPAAGKLAIHKKGYKRAELELNLSPGKNVETSIVLEAAGNLLVRMRNGGRAFDGEAVVRMRRTDVETAGSSSASTFDGVAAFEDLEGGPYELKVEQIDGFKPVPRRPVSIELGKTATIVIDLEKAN